MLDLDMTMKVKIDKQEYIKIKKFCVSQDAINRIKWQHTELENYICDKRLISKIYKELYNLGKNKQLNFKMGKRLKQTFLQRRYTIANKLHIKGCATSLFVKYKSKSQCYINQHQNKKKTLQHFSIKNEYFAFWVNFIAQIRSLFGLLVSFFSEV